MSSFSLYEMVEEFQDAANAMENYEIPEDVIRDTLEGMSMAIRDKAVNVSAFIKSVDSDVAQIDKEIDRLTDRLRMMKSRNDWLKNYLLTNLQAAGLTEVKTALHSIKIVNNPPSLVVDNQSMIPERFMKSVTTISVDKSAIKKALKTEIVPGCHIEIGKRLNIK